MSANLDTTQFVCIITSSSLDEAKKNKLNPAREATFFANFAFPPEAAPVLKAVLDAGLMQKFKMIPPGVDYRIKTNAQSSKPIAGIPADWFVVRAQTQYAPYLADPTGARIDQPEGRKVFYPGKKVRAALTAYGWTAPGTGAPGASFNLNGVMAVEDAPRLNIGQGAVANAFQQHAQPAAEAQAPANPFANGAMQAQQQAGVTQAAPAANANPFMQQAGGFSQ
ncbi:hypothetical protein 2B_00059 [Ralstonia phage Bakoly]|uniref:Phage protein n=2 Tax=Bakolyvirus bakoly TaxID=2846039 RepID=A0A7G5BB38_9CAUD|nr:hypothetical protein KE333_gp59 [Ralstonia phage Bakoly]QMV32632.1 hypothetical protein 2B_00059 [Ralstonia phage Bakoly]QMV33511.1 hypothetical protein 30B_00004 [Ralstonia phage Jenny]